MFLFTCAFSIFSYSFNVFVYEQKWIQEHHVLSIVLRDSLHQPQYVEKLEKILRFMIKEKALTTIDLDRLWEAQVLFIFAFAHLFYSYDAEAAVTIRTMWWLVDHYWFR